jgi:DNA-directed RNA polymerase subunit RPC12/RpoP
MVWTPGFTDWQPASTLSWLFSHVPPPKKRPAATLAELRCPNCSSEAFQSLQVIYESGTSSIRTTTTGTVSTTSAYGSSHQGVSVHTTSGVQQTQAAMDAAPPEKMETQKPALAIVAGIVLGIIFVSKAEEAGSIKGLGILFFPAIGLLYWGLYTLRQRLRWNKTVWPERYDLWLRTYRCLRCGKFFCLGEPS